MDRSINWTPDGYATHLPSGDKTFSRKKKGHRISVILKVSKSLPNQKKNGAARLDLWEIFVLLPLKISFHFISFRKYKN